MANGNSTFRPTIAQQLFTISSGIAGGVAGFVLANRLSDVDEVSRNQVIAAAAISGAFTLGSVFLIKPDN